MVEKSHHHKLVRKFCVLGNEVTRPHHESADRRKTRPSPRTGSRPSLATSFDTSLPTRPLPLGRYLLRGDDQDFDFETGGRTFLPLNGSDITV